MKILTVLGARPQFIKAAAVSREFATRPEIEEVIVHTGQHFDANMSDIFFEEMSIPLPNHQLNINSMSHGKMTGLMMAGIEEVCQKEQPDLVLVYGDTNSTIAGALAAKKLHIKVGHVEAGLRSFNMCMPEEINRILTDRISDYLFCPTQKALDNLQDEGFDNIDCEIVQCGDVMYDAALFYQKMAQEKSQIIQQAKLSNTPFLLATVHRQENTDDPTKLAGIVNALNHLSKDIRIALPLHPRTKKRMESHGLSFDFDVLDPLGYFDMLELLQNCKAVLTDSGGLQKEAYYFKKPGVTLREQTEWVELVDNAYSTLVGADTNKIIDATNRALNSNGAFDKMLYGSGNGSKIIADTVLK